MDTDESLRHGEHLAPAIERVLEQAGATPKDLTRIAVGVGPGPFTGLRVGLVTARTMGFALGIPVAGVCSLDILAHEYAGKAGHFIVAADARRKEVYWASYEQNRRVGDPKVDRPADVPNADDTTIGEGGLLYPDAFPNAIAPYFPRASVLAEGVANNSFELLPPEPLYLRRPDAVEAHPPKRVS